jgi:hypothetical protein
MASANAEGKVVVRVQPPRQAKVQLGKLTEWLPENVALYGLTVKGDDRWWQAERIKRYGVLFNDAIKMWQLSSKQIRQFFLDGILPITSWNTLRIVDVSSIPKDSVLTKKSLEQLNFVRKDIYRPLEKLERLAAFWKVMNSNTLPTFANDAVLFRGVRYDTYDQLLDQGYVVDNILTNWTSSQTIALNFTDKYVFQCQFPKGARYLFTGHGDQNEHEYIIPGGRFQVTKSPHIAKVEKGLYLRLTPLSYDAKDQTFAWPGKSTSPSTRKNYQESIALVLTSRFLHLWETAKLFQEAKTEISGLAEKYGYETKINFEPLEDFYKAGSRYEFPKAWKAATSPPPPPPPPTASISAPVLPSIIPTIAVTTTSPVSISVSPPSNGTTAMTLNGGYFRPGPVRFSNKRRTARFIPRSFEYVFSPRPPQ